MTPAPSQTLESLLAGYRLCARSEGKSPASITIVTRSVQYLEHYLAETGADTRVGAITTHHLRAFILSLRERRAWADHPFTRPQDRGLTIDTIHTYLRSIRIFFSWLVSEEIIAENPFHRVKLPRLPYKIIPAFTDTQLKALFASIDTTRPSGFRDHTMILMMLDTGLRISEVVGLQLGNVHIEDRLVRVTGKGNKQRVVPLGQYLARQLWRYMVQSRPEPALPTLDQVFLSRNGTRMTKDTVRGRMLYYGRKAGITGVRISPHTLRHTAAISYLRNGGDVFSLQRLLGHSTLEMTRRYCQVADTDVQKVHRTASPVDNLRLGIGGGGL